MDAVHFRSMSTGFAHWSTCQANPGAPSPQIRLGFFGLRLGRKVSECYPRWAVWSLRLSVWASTGHLNVRSLGCHDPWHVFMEP